MKKIAYTVGDLQNILSKVDKNLPLSNSFTIALGYQTPMGFEELDDDVEKEGFLAIDVYPNEICRLGE